MGFLDLLNDVTVWDASCFLGLVRFGPLRGRGKKEHRRTVLWRLLLTGVLVGMLRAVHQAAGLFLVLWPVLSKSYGLDLTHTSFWALSFLGSRKVLQTGASDGKGVVPACLAPGLGNPGLISPPPWGEIWD